MIEIHGHRFEVFILVLETHENVDLVLSIKNIFELEGVVNSRDSCFSFLEQVNIILSKRIGHIKTKEAKINKDRSTFHRWNLRFSDSKNAR